MTLTMTKKTAELKFPLYQMFFVCIEYIEQTLLIAFASAENFDMIR